MTISGQLRERIRFDKRLSASDGAGNTEGDWDVANGITRWAQFQMRTGSEAVVAARLAGEQPLTMVIRYDTQTALIGDDWRAVDTNTGIVYAIHSAADMDRRRQWLTLTCEGGVTP